MTEALRAVVEEVRGELNAGTREMPRVRESDILNAAERYLERLDSPGLRRVLNGTGVVLHTNLGRAPLPQAALDRVVSVGRGYCNLELDLERGERGDGGSRAQKMRSWSTIRPRRSP